MYSAPTRAMEVEADIAAIPVKDGNVTFSVGPRAWTRIAVYLE